MSSLHLIISKSVVKSELQINKTLLDVEPFIENT